MYLPASFADAIGVDTLPILIKEVKNDEDAVDRAADRTSAAGQCIRFAVDDMAIAPISCNRCPPSITTGSRERGANLSTRYSVSVPLARLGFHARDQTLAFQHPKAASKLLALYHFARIAARPIIRLKSRFEIDVRHRVWQSRSGILP